MESLQHVLTRCLGELREWRAGHPDAWRTPEELYARVERTLRALADPGLYERLDATTATLMDGLQAAARRHGVALRTRHLGSMFGLFFSDQLPRGFDEVMACDAERFARFFHAMLDRGVYLAPSAFEAGFVSAAHGEAEIRATLEAADAAFAELG